MFILFIFGAFFSGFVTMAIAEQKGFDKWLGFAVGPIACTGLIFLLSAMGFFGDDTYQPVGQYSQYGYGATLEECMQKANAWFEHSKEVALEVIADEKKRRKDGWKKLNIELGLQMKDLEEMRKFALPNRHGKYPAISYEERERIMNLARTIISGLISKF